MIISAASSYPLSLKKSFNWCPQTMFIVVGTRSRRAIHTSSISYPKVKWERKNKTIIDPERKNLPKFAKIHGLIIIIIAQFAFQNLLNPSPNITPVPLPALLVLDTGHLPYLIHGPSASIKPTCSMVHINKYFLPTLFLPVVDGNNESLKTRPFDSFN